MFNVFDMYIQWIVLKGKTFDHDVIKSHAFLLDSYNEHKMLQISYIYYKL